MSTLPGFESLEKIKRTYSWFDLETKKFSSEKNNRYKGGIPVCYDAESRRLYIDAGDTHSLVYGATGSLKTRSVVSPTIKVLGYAGESMIIHDPKGELYTRHAGDLVKQGYSIIEINLRNPAYGNSWNPLFLPYAFYRSGNMDRAAELVNDVSHSLTLSEVSQKDPFWDYAASDLLYGLIMLLFRYCKDHDMPENAVNIGNLLTLKRMLFAGRLQAKDNILWKYAAEDELIAASLSGTVYAPNDTRNSILSVFDQKMRAFTIQPALLDMLANNDFDVAEIGRKKTAVFIITPDEKTSYHRLVSLFIKQSYEYLIYTATYNEGNRVGNRITYVIDEFSALPRISDMPAMISAARSRDIRFLLVVQSRSSLRQKYQEDADTIISNCMNWIYFTSRELDLLKEISELCGMQRNNMPNISIYDLQHFSKERCEALVLAGRLKPAKVTMLDIDRFGDKKYAVLEHMELARQDRIKLTFELKGEMRQKFGMPDSQNHFTRRESSESKVSSDISFLADRLPEGRMGMKKADAEKEEQTPAAGTEKDVKAESKIAKEVQEAMRQAVSSMMTKTTEDPEE